MHRKSVRYALSELCAHVLYIVQDRTCTILGWPAGSVHCVLHELCAHVHCALVEGMYDIGLARGKCTLRTS